MTCSKLYAVGGSAAVACVAFADVPLVPTGGFQLFQKSVVKG